MRGEGPRGGRGEMTRLVPGAERGGRALGQHGGGSGGAVLAEPGERGIPDVREPVLAIVCALIAHVFTSWSQSRWAGRVFRGKRGALACTPRIIAAISRLP